jgi:hypothetical protein
LSCPNWRQGYAPWPAIIVSIEENPYPLASTLNFVPTLLFPVPPKNVFQFMCAIDAVGEYMGRKVDFADDGFGLGFSWTEKKMFSKRAWTITAYDRRALTYTMESKGLVVKFAAKKGGAGSCNAQMNACGPDAAKFMKTDGDRLSRLMAYLETG